jgi:hypothetical protein
LSVQRWTFSRSNDFSVVQIIRARTISHSRRR